MSREIATQRCHKIPKDKLDVFLVKLTMTSSTEPRSYFEADYVFDAGDHYDVVVNQYGCYPWLSNDVESFAKKLNEPENKKQMRVTTGKRRWW